MLNIKTIAISAAILLFIPIGLFAQESTFSDPNVDYSFVLPESAVIMDYLDERYPEPPLLPADPAARGLARLQVWRFDDLLGDDYYAFRRGDPNRLEERLAALDLGHQLFVDIAYIPWVIRAKHMLGVDLPAHLDAWLERALERPSVATELEIVAALAT